MTANTVEKCDHMVCTVAVSPDEVDAGAELTVTVNVSCPHGCELHGRMVSIRDQADTELAAVALVQTDDGSYVADELLLRAPGKAAKYTYRAAVVAQDRNGLSHEECSTQFDFLANAHATLVNAWGLPSAITAGERLRFLVGIKCSNNCNLGGGMFRILDQDGAEAAAGMLADQTWPGTDALYFAEAEALAPPSTGDYSWRVEAPGSNSGLPHEDGACAFAVKVVGRPDHQVTVAAFDSGKGAAIKGAHVLLHPYRALTDDNGIATLKVTAGRYNMVISGFRYTPYQAVIDAESDVTIRAELTVEPELSPFYPQPPSAGSNFLSEDDNDVPRP